MTFKLLCNVNKHPCGHGGQPLWLTLFPRLPAQNHRLAAIPSYQRLQNRRQSYKKNLNQANQTPS